MKYSWWRSVLPISGLMAFRMLGLFMLIPVFSVYAQRFPDATPALIGIALGAYGLTQGLLQLPFGVLSDRIGRKPVITIGLFLFVTGSVIGAISDSIYGVILARILQGTGAIGSVLIALLTDLTEETKRARAMAVLGMSIGLSFMLAMLISPPLTRLFGLQGLFSFMAGMGLIGFILLYSMIPNAPRKIADSLSGIGRLKLVLNKTLLPYNVGIFIQHAIFTASFFAVPLLLRSEIIQGNINYPWQFYLPQLLFSFAIAVSLIAFAEKKQKIAVFYKFFVVVTLLSQLVLAIWGGNSYALWAGMFTYFIAFNFLEASLPAEVSKKAPPEHKGSAMGVYSSCQFLGIFVGGVGAGFGYQWWGIVGVFGFNLALGLAWIWAQKTSIKN